MRKSSQNASYGAAKVNKFLKALFIESQKDDDNGGYDNSGYNTPPEEQVGASEKLAKLVKLLTSVGIEDPKSRLAQIGSDFALTSCCAEQQVADNKLLSLEIGSTLADEGFVCVPADTDIKSASSSIRIVCVDCKHDCCCYDIDSFEDHSKQDGTLEKDIANAAKKIVEDAVSDAEEERR